VHAQYSIMLIICVHCTVIFVSLQFNSYITNLDMLCSCFTCFKFYLSS